MRRSSRFIIIQEGIFVGLAACILYMLNQNFPIIPFLSFLGPIVLGVYGIKTIQHIKQNGGNDGG